MNNKVAGLVAKSDFNTAMAAVVAKSDYNAATIVAYVNNAESGIQIAADKIDFNGKTINLNAEQINFKSGSFSIKNGSTTTFSVDSSGNVSMTGAINATSGSIGGFTIESNGNISGSDATFSGKINATSGSFTGTITSTNATLSGQLLIQNGDSDGLKLDSNGNIQRWNKTMNSWVPLYAGRCVRLVDSSINYLNADDDFVISGEHCNSIYMPTGVSNGKVITIKKRGGSVMVYPGSGQRLVVDHIYNTNEGKDLNNYDRAEFVYYGTYWYWNCMNV